jgi:hypothetical protein
MMRMHCAEIEKSGGPMKSIPRLEFNPLENSLVAVGMKTIPFSANMEFNAPFEPSR